jgi:hypothetical protein
MRASDDQYQRDFDKHDLAIWMIEHGARTRTVNAWTGLSRYRVQALSRRYDTRTGDHRRRGVSPFQSAYFAKSLTLEAESLTFALIALGLKVIPPTKLPEARRVLPDAERGARLMFAYEIYRALVPKGQISLERAILFVIELAARRNLTLRRCKTCPNVMVVERLGVRHEQCPLCRSRRRTQSTSTETDLTPPE